MGVVIFDSAPALVGDCSFAQKGMRIAFFTFANEGYAPSLAVRTQVKQQGEDIASPPWVARADLIWHCTGA